MKSRVQCLGVRFGCDCELVLSFWWLGVVLDVVVGTCGCSDCGVYLTWIFMFPNPLLEGGNVMLVLLSFLCAHSTHILC